VFGNFRFQNTTRCILTHTQRHTHRHWGALSLSQTHTRALLQFLDLCFSMDSMERGHYFCNLQFAYTAAESRIIQPTNLPQKRQLEHNNNRSGCGCGCGCTRNNANANARCRMDMDSKPNRNRNYAQLKRARVSFGPQIIIIIITTIIIIKLSVDNARSEATSEWAKRRIHSERIRIRNRYLSESTLAPPTLAARVAAGVAAVALGETKTTQAIPIPQGLLFRPKNNVPQQLQQQQQWQQWQRRRQQLVSYRNVNVLIEFSFMARYTDCATEC